MAKYKPGQWVKVNIPGRDRVNKIGQFVKVKNKKGLYQAVLERKPNQGCIECALSDCDCHEHFDCSQIPFNACLKRIK